MAASIEELTQQAKFIFKGTVKQKGAAAMSGVPVDKNTLVVSVDQIIHAPELLQAYAGKEITVQLGKGQSASVGQQRVFYTNGWIYGASIAVVSLGTTPVSAAERAMAAAQSAPERQAQERAADASLVVKGRVTDVRAVKRAKRAPISEHDPYWQEAVIEVDDVAKGSVGGKKPKRVVVRFAASNDVKWYRAPKFTAGQQVRLTLGTESGRARGAFEPAQAPQKGVYTVTDPADVQSEAQYQSIRSLNE